MTFSSKARIPWWRLEPRRVLVIVLFVALFTMSAREIADPDFWWHLATGRYMVETRSIPRHDVFSYTATTHKWITHEWLTQVGMIALYNLGGLPALLLVTSALITISFVFVYLQCDARPHLAVFAVLLGALASAVTWGARPQMLNMLLVALFMWLLGRYRKGHNRALWLLPLLTALWVNLHSGFFLGLWVVAFFILFEWLANVLAHRTPETLTLDRVRNLGLSLLACVLLSLLNPNGPKMLWYPFETLGSSAMQQYIQEWASPDFHRPEYWPTIALLFGSVAALVFSRRERDLTDVLFLFGFGFAALLSARHVPLFAVVATPILTRYVAKGSVGRLEWDLARQRSPIAPSRTIVFVNWALVALIVLVGGARVAHVLRQNRDVEARRFPVGAIEYLESAGLSEKRMYNSYNWGGYLLWRGYKVFIDGRADVYLDEFMNEYVLAYQLRGDWRRPLDKFGVDYILIESGASLEALLQVSDEWERVYRDDQAVVFLRVD